MSHPDLSHAPLLAVSHALHKSKLDHTDKVFNLTVLVHQSASGETVARSANLAVAEVQAASIRSALSQIVAASKALIAEHLASDRQIPWVDPPATPTEAESRFMVPLHL